MRKIHSIILILVFLFFCKNTSFAQGGCMSTKVEISAIAQNSSLIIEGEVISKNAYQIREGFADIYTVQEVRVYKSFKGIRVPQIVYVVTEGGQVGLFSKQVTAENNFVVGDIGVFFLSPARFGMNHLNGSSSADYYEVYAAEQGFLKYNWKEDFATNSFEEIRDLPQGVYRWLNSTMGLNPTVITPGPTSPILTNPKGPGILAVPTITSFTPTSIVAGTRALLTINGSGFGATRGTGFVEFRNANNPGSVVYVQPKANDYRSWSDTQIQVWVPSNSNGNGPSAGTGQIRVTNSTVAPNQATSAGTLTITYSAINVEFNNTGQQTEHLNNNGSGGYTFQYHSPEFSGNAAATASFVRSLNTWTCATNINWNVGATSTKDIAANDTTNIVRFDNGAELPAGVLGRATSYFSGCVNVAAPSDTVWTCVEIDVVFDDATAWQYGPALPTISQYDFETVSVHELGHAHQLQHVINTSAVMHATVSNGTTKRTLLVSSEEAGGDYQMTKAFIAHGACKPLASAMTPLNIGGTVSIIANPGGSICSGASVTFTATATVPVGTFTYQWKKNGTNVGTNAATYTDATLTNGNTIQCVVTVTGGCNLILNSNTITTGVISSVTPSVSISANPGSTICAGASVTFTAVPTNGGTTPSYQWRVNGVNAGTNSTTFTTTTLTNGQIVTCVLTSNAACVSPTTATSNSITMTVNPVVVPSVSISANPGNTICAGASVTFTAVPTNGGTTPAYQWRVNGVNAGTNSATFTTTTLTNGQIVTCVLTSNAPCVSPTTATSNSITMTVNPVVVPSVGISANPGSTICAGTSVTFTATPTNGGTTPSFQWRVNGVNAGTNSTTFTTTTLTNSQVVTCVLTSNATCASPATATSNSITMTVNPVLVPSISISANPGSTICSGSSVTFTATPTNGGTTPSYQWRVNGVNAGTNSATFTTTTLTNGQVVTCVLTSNANCASTTTATSNSITMNVTTTVTPSISIQAFPIGAICPGTSVTFTAFPTNGGTTPSYQWRVNGVNAGTNSSSFTTTTLTNGQIVTCVLTSNAACASTTTATSNSITMTVNPIVTPLLSISVSGGTTICAGQSVVFFATPTNGGFVPSYQWKVNGVNAGTNASGFSTNTLTNGQIVSCVMTTSAPCATSPTATSNNITMTVTPTVTPSVSISVNPSSTICAGTSVTFTATPTNGGTTPNYQWKVNGVNAGTNSTTFTTTTLTNGQIVTCDLISNANCASPQTVTSNSITMTVNPAVVPSVSISANPGSSICAGTSVTFTATPTNGGTTPIYQWRVNGVNAGTNSSSFTTSTLTNNQVVTCILTSNAACLSTATATSNNISMAVISTITPSVSISANPGGTICAGTSVTFTATPTNGGLAPSYQWRVNGVNTGTNSATFTTSALTNGQVVSCVLTSNAICVSPTTVASNNITMSVTSTVTPSVSISANPGNAICLGSSVTFTATPTNGGTTPSYQWRVNGVNAGTNSAFFTTTTLNNGQIVTCILTSNATCPNPTSVTSNSITMTVNSVVVPSINISANPGSTICAGASVTFTATPGNGGTTPSYQWRVNGVNAGTNSATFTTTTLTNGQVVTCVLTSNANCVSTTTATSNSITMTVNPVVVPSISISANPGNSICAGTSVTFTATPTNGGTTPSYQWRINGINAGTNSPTFTTTALTNGQVVTCVLNSNATCATPATATSNSITMTVSIVPTITSFAPSSGAPGSGVSITGTNFNNTVVVRFNGTIASYTFVNSTSLNATVPVGATTGTITVQRGSCTAVSTNSFIVTPPNATLNLKTFIQGYYNGSGSMVPVLFNQGVNPSTSVMDSINIELRNSSNISQIIASRRSEVNTSGISTYSLPGSLIGNSYYIVVKYRNAIETWSKNPVLINSNTTFDFTTP